LKDAEIDRIYCFVFVLVMTIPMTIATRLRTTETILPIETIILILLIK
jgi:hypothetical protein